MSEAYTGARRPVSKLAEKPIKLSIAPTPLRGNAV